MGTSNYSINIINFGPYISGSMRCQIIHVQPFAYNPGHSNTIPTWKISTIGSEKYCINEFYISKYFINKFYIHFNCGLNCVIMIVLSW